MAQRGQAFEVARLANGWHSVKFPTPGRDKMGILGGSGYGLRVMPKMCPICGEDTDGICLDVYPHKFRWFKWWIGLLVGNLLFRPLSIFKCRKCKVQDGFLIRESSGGRIVLDVRNERWITALRQKLG